MAPEVVGDSACGFHTWSCPFLLLQLPIWVGAMITKREKRGLRAEKVKVLENLEIEQQREHRGIESISSYCVTLLDSTWQGVGRQGGGGQPTSEWPRTLSPDTDAVLAMYYLFHSNVSCKKNDWCTWVFTLLCYSMQISSKLRNNKVLILLSGFSETLGANPSYCEFFHMESKAGPKEREEAKP